MKIRPLTAEFSIQTDRQADMIKLIIIFFKIFRKLLNNNENLPRYNEVGLAPCSLERYRRQPLLVHPESRLRVFGQCEICAGILKRGKDPKKKIPSQ